MTFYYKHYRQALFLVDVDADGDRRLELAHTYSYDFIILDLIPPGSWRGIAYEETRTYQANDNHR
jgi:DNA-binding response OmpR family regulator